MTPVIVAEPLTNRAYGFPRGFPRRVRPVALACIHITGNSATAAMADYHRAATMERNYANRAASPGPSAHYYVARDGWAIEAIDPARFAAWSNGDVNSPNTHNVGVVRAIAFRGKGYNVNEAYWIEFENVGYRSQQPVNAAQRQAMASRIAAMSTATGLPVNRETVHGHWEINGVDRQNCPSPPAAHAALLDDVISRANLILHPPALRYKVVIAAPGVDLFTKPDGAPAGHIRSASYICLREKSGGVWWYVIDFGSLKGKAFKPSRFTTATRVP